MLETVLHYLILIFAVGCFSLIYFTLLRQSVDKVLSREKSINYIYLSFLIRICLAGVFFFFLLKYYRNIRDFIFIILIFIGFRYIAIRRDKVKIFGKSGDEKK